jgi:RNase P subunit RPR2
MCEILIAICPQCRTEVNTGISVDDQTMNQLAPRLEVLVLCDNCREYQRMMVKDLYFAQAAPRSVAA